MPSFVLLDQNTTVLTGNVVLKVHFLVFIIRTSYVPLALIKT